MTILTTGISHISRRLRQADMAQLMLLFFAIIILSLTIAWPENPQLANNSWIVLAQSKLALLIFLATLYGSLSRTAFDKLVALAALCCFHIFSLPLDAATYAASFPDVNLLWAFSLALIALIAYFMLSYFCSSLLHRVNLGFFAIPLVLLLPIMAVFADIRLGINLFNPFSSISFASLPYLGINLAIGVIGLVILFRQLAKENKIGVNKTG